jgi:hypothetical protein
VYLEKTRAMNLFSFIAHFRPEEACRNHFKDRNKIRFFEQGDTNATCLNDTKPFRQWYVNCEKLWKKEAMFTLEGIIEMDEDYSTV